MRRSEDEVDLVFVEEEEEEAAEDDDVDDDDPGVLRVELEVVSRLRCPCTNRVRVVLIRWEFEEDMMRRLNDKMC